VTAQDPLAPDGGRGDEHLGWRLSALLDGELPVAEELSAREHLGSCDLCQEEFVEITAARSLVRGLGDVEPPHGFLDRVLRRVQRRNQQRLGLLALLALALVWVLVLLIGAGAEPPDATPDLDVAVERHRAVAAGEPLPDGKAITADTLPAPFVFAPTLGADLVLEGIVDLPDRTVLGHYRGPDGVVSVAAQEGRLVADDLPGGSRALGVDPSQATPGTATEPVVWVVPAPGAHGGSLDVLVVDQGPVVVTLVGPVAGESLEAVAERLPEPQAYSLGEQVRRSLEGFARRLGVG